MDHTLSKIKRKRGMMMMMMMVMIRMMVMMRRRSRKVEDRMEQIYYTILTWCNFPCLFVMYFPYFHAVI